MTDITEINGKQYKQCSREIVGVRTTHNLGAVTMKYMMNGSVELNFTNVEHAIK